MQDNRTQDVLNYIKSGGISQTITTIQERFPDLDIQVVYNICSRLQRSGRLTRVRYGEYTSAPKGSTGHISTFYRLLMVSSASPKTSPELAALAERRSFKISRPARTRNIRNLVKAGLLTKIAAGHELRFQYTLTRLGEEVLDEFWAKQ